MAEYKTSMQTRGYSVTKGTETTYYELQKWYINDLDITFWYSDQDTHNPGELQAVYGRSDMDQFHKKGFRETAGPMLNLEQGESLRKLCDAGLALFEARNSMLKLLSELDNFKDYVPRKDR